MAVSFTAASSHHMTLANTSSMQLTGDYTVMAWIKTSTSGTDKRIIQNFAAPLNAFGWTFFVNSSNVVRMFLGDNTSGSGLSGVTSVTTGNWVHAATTRSGSSRTIYVDGVSDNTDTFAPTILYTGTMYPRIGAGNVTGSNLNFMNGSIAEIRVWKGTALTTAQIAAEMRSPQPIFSLTTLVGWWPLDNQSLPATYTDFSQTGNTATPVNTPAIADTTHF